MNTHYTDEVNTQIVLSLLKQHGIRKVVASPGTTNIRLVASMQQDSFFEMYSAADERSAAYIACGMAEESGESVVLSCTGATASRNYIPGLTEAFYRKLPVLAITSTQHSGRIGQNVPQVIDRTQQLNDMVKYSVQIPVCHSQEDLWASNLKVNTAILELTRNGGGPVHINLETTYSSHFDVKTLPKQRVIKRYCIGDEFPKINHNKVGVFVGAHSAWNHKLTSVVDMFCAQYDAVVLCDHTSNFRGKYRALYSICTKTEHNDFDLIIHIGNISGAYMSFNCKEYWRVNPDGEVRDTFKKLTKVFQMTEEQFFEAYINDGEDSKCTSLQLWQKCFENINSKIPELPFSNIWIAKNSSMHIPETSIIHFGILNTLRSWNFFETPSTVRGYSNTGGFGIDGILSTAIGSALANPEQLVFCIIGDLAFFYDMNSLGNRHLPSNIRIMLINNGKGTEFRNYNHPGAMFGKDADYYIAAANHYGKKSRQLVKHYAEDLGIKYYSAGNKEEYLQNEAFFFVEKTVSYPILFEVFTDSKDESDALELINGVMDDKEPTNMDKIKCAVKKVIGQKGVEKIDKIRVKINES